MKLYAISDLHTSYDANWTALQAIARRPSDWLIVAGDVCETEDDLARALSLLQERFAKVFWVPGNHELWSLSRDSNVLRGEARYQRLVARCRQLGVITPEDPYLRWPGEGPPCVIAPLFLLYDYSFRPDDVPASYALQWAMEEGLVCQDEYVLHHEPYPSKIAWCEARCAATEARLREIPAECQTILVNHFPLRRDHAILPLIPRFSIWCGTRRTEEWHLRYRARVVVSGHLHIRTTRWRDGVRFEEVSLGYPRHWAVARGVDAYLREIL